MGGVRWAMFSGGVDEWVSGWGQMGYSDKYNSRLTAIFRSLMSCDRPHGQVD